MVDDTWGYTRRVAIRPNKPSAFVVELPVSVVAWHFPDRTECRRFFQSAQPKNFPCPALLKRDNRFYRVREGDLFETLQGFANKALLVGHERLFSFASPDANQRNAQVVGQKPDRVQNDPLFAERASQNGMDLIDNEHAHFELSRRDPGALP
jgi:hypothetical protein